MYWEIEFIDGTVVTQKERKIDPNRPDKQAKLIRWGDLQVNIPQGALPVYAKQKCVAQLGTGETIREIIKIGYNINKRRVMKCIEGNKIFDLIDNKGC